jgi:hypothetical protein
MKKLLLLPLAALLLTGCINDRASYNIDGHNYALTIIRDQRYFWDQKLEMSVVAARLPDCQRRHKLPMTAPAESKIELYQTGSATFILKLSGVMYLVETTTCEGFQKLAEVPPNGLGDHLGDFYEVDGKYRFVATPAAPTPVAPAAAVGAAPGVEPAAAVPAAPTAPSAEPPSSFGPASAPVAPAKP